MRGVDQGLHLDQQRPGALLRGHDAGARYLLRMLRQKQGRWVGHAAQAAVGHGEHAQLVDRAEAVLEGAHQAERRMRVALEIQHGIDDMLEHARAGQGAVLGDVPDHDDGDAGLLGQARELGGAFAHLRHRTRRRSELAAIERLDGIDHRHGRFALGHCGLDGFEPDLGQQVDLVGRRQTQAAGAQGHLLGRFFARDVKHRNRFGQRGQGLQQQRGLAYARIAADEHHGAGHQTAAQHAVEFVQPGRLARRFARFDVGQTAHRRRGRQRRVAMRAARRGGRLDRFIERVPGVAMRALALPLEAGAAAFSADENSAGFSHALMVLERAAGPAQGGRRADPLGGAANT